MIIFIDIENYISLTKSALNLKYSFFFFLLQWILDFKEWKAFSYYSILLFSSYAENQKLITLIRI